MQLFYCIAFSRVQTPAIAYVSDASYTQVCTNLQKTCI